MGFQPVMANQRRPRFTRRVKFESNAMAINMQGKKYSSVPETIKHILQVGEFINKIAMLLISRIYEHDKSKLEEPELRYFDAHSQRLAGLTYGSDEYKQSLKELEPALKHHYAVNRHHPEHFENGIRGMTLIDIVEMFCDWYASTKRHEDGNIMRSIEMCQKRFDYSDDLKAIFENTYNEIFAEGPNVQAKP